MTFQSKTLSSSVIPVVKEATDVRETFGMKGQTKKVPFRRSMKLLIFSRNIFHILSLHLLGSAELWKVINWRKKTKKPTKNPPPKAKQTNLKPKANFQIFHRISQFTIFI